MTADHTQKRGVAEQVTVGAHPAVAYGSLTKANVESKSFDSDVGLKTFAGTYSSVDSGSAASTVDSLTIGSKPSNGTESIDKQPSSAPDVSALDERKQRWHERKEQRQRHKIRGLLVLRWPEEERRCWNEAQHDKNERLAREALERSSRFASNPICHDAPMDSKLATCTQSAGLPLSSPAFDEHIHRETHREQQRPCAENEINSGTAVQSDQFGIDPSIDDISSM